MKNLILSLLGKGYVKTSKYTLDDLAKKFFPLAEIARTDEILGIRCMENHPFWHPSNNDNRIALMTDLRKSRLGDVRSSYYHILVRFESGDRYGMPNSGQI